MKSILYKYHNSYMTKTVVTLLCLVVPFLSWTLVAVIWAADLSIYYKESDSAVMRTVFSILFLIAELVACLDVFSMIFAILS